VHGAEREARIVAGAVGRIDRVFGARADESFGDVPRGVACSVDRVRP
jgi:hypothetical protein